MSVVETGRVLDRLPQLMVEDEDRAEFKLAPPSRPPDRPGRNREEPFPPPAGKQVQKQELTGPLQVLAHAPEGEVDLAPHLSLAFSHDMIPLGRVEADAAIHPAIISPQPPGRWRWLGTRTLLFEPEGRFPMAATYQVEVPADTVSDRGLKLPGEFRWSFSTPPIKMVNYYPRGKANPKNPLIFISFNQKIDPAAVYPFIRIVCRDREYSFKPARPEEMEADPEVKKIKERAAAGRWLALRPLTSFPAGGRVRVQIKAGAPSAEGPPYNPRGATIHLFRPRPPGNRRPMLRLEQSLPPPGSLVPYIHQSPGRRRL